jgi:alkanesulfonate monooxygenase SsuD/methylene tetrahydromethanopterin reductase-like flavin-dependent oxidoreductase (luciferase family)
LTQYHADGNVSSAFGRAGCGCPKDQENGEFIMKVGLLSVFQNFENRMTDAEQYRIELDVCARAEELDFDSIAVVEHHFFNYGMSPDNTQTLSYLAAKTSRIGLLTGAVILPWNNPLRVVEKIILLDHLSGGRAMFGIGRGLARREYETFGVEMSEARDRFEEAADMVVAGVETGIVEGKGPYYPQKRTEVRPGPLKSFKDRLYCVAMSPESIPSCVRVGAAMMSFASKPWVEMAPHFETYRKTFQEKWGRSAPTPTCVDFVFVDESADKAEEMAREYIANYYKTILEHYEFAGQHFDKKAYGKYAKDAEELRQVGYEAAAKAFVDVNTWGSPQQILEKLEARQKVLGDFNLTIEVSYGGMPQGMADRNMELFAKKVLPELHSWK